MLNACFVIFISLTLLYFLAANHKQVATLILFHSLIQYFWTLFMWSFQLNQSLSWVLLAFLAASSCLLIMASRLRVNKQEFAIKLFFTISQWALLIMLAVFIGFKSPFLFAETDFPIEGSVGRFSPHITLHPLLRLSGNLIAFFLFFQLITHRKEFWDFSKSVLLLGPSIVYFSLMAYLRFLQVSMSSLTFT
ncbi:MAG: hypothetical protein AAF804_08595 [Bacteroidota bacterium]